MQRIASNGYMRKKLTVFQGGQQGQVQASLRATTLEVAGGGAVAVATSLAAELHATTSMTPDSRIEQIKAARMKGYEGDSCGECGNFTLVRNGTCLKCDTCGGTSGCS